MQRIYLDHAATTPLDQRVFEAMKPLLIETFGNPSSSHFFGRSARAAIDDARDLLASSLGAASSEVVFTSGGTESDNMAILGIAASSISRGRHIITQVTEHHAVLDTCRWLEGHRFEVTYLPVDRQGVVDPDDLRKSLKDDTILVSIMHANNEAGTIQPIKELARLSHERGALFHTDAVQTFGILPVDVKDLEVDLLTITAHKLYGPKGIGALYVRSGIALEPILHGGGQEREKRQGTENAAGIVGFAEAAKIAVEGRNEFVERNTQLRDRFIAEAFLHIPDIFLNGHQVDRLPGNANLSFIGADSESLLLSLDLEGIAASSGSACTAGSLEPSHVLKGMNLPPRKSQISSTFQPW